MPTETTKKILHVEDSPNYIMTIMDAVEAIRGTHDIELVQATTKEEALAILDEQGDGLYAVITDNSLPDDSNSAVEIATAALAKGIKKVVIASYDFDKASAPNGSVVWYKNSSRTGSIQDITSLFN